jgi:hypothetical protein
MGTILSEAAMILPESDRTKRRNRHGAARRLWWVLAGAVLFAADPVSAQTACTMPTAFPNATNTGYAGAGVTLSQMSTSCPTTITSPGTYDLCSWSGQININSSNVTIKRSYINSGGAGFTFRITDPTLTGILIEDTTIDGGGTAGTQTGGFGLGYGGSGNGSNVQVTLLRLNISNGGDCVSEGTQTLLMQDSYCHDLLAGGSGASLTHYNGVQNNGGWSGDVYLIHNTINNNLQNQTDAVMIDNGWGAYTGTEMVAGNYLNSGNFDVYVDGNNGGQTGAIPNAYYVSNEFDSSAPGFNGYIYPPNASSAVPYWGCNETYSSKSALPLSTCGGVGCQNPPHTLTLGAVTATAPSGGNSTVSIPYSGTATGTIHASVDCDNNGTYETATAGTSSPLSVTCTNAASSGTLPVMVWSTNSAAAFGSVTLGTGTSALGRPGQPTLIQ